jgi:hypothetical protein
METQFDLRLFLLHWKYLPPQVKDKAARIIVRSGEREIEMFRYFFRNPWIHVPELLKDSKPNYMMIWFMVPDFDASSGACFTKEEILEWALRPFAFTILLRFLQKQRISWIPNRVLMYEAVEFWIRRDRRKIMERIRQEIKSKRSTAARPRVT